MDQNLINQLFQVCLIPMLGALTTFIVIWIKAKSAELQKKTDNDILNKYGKQSVAQLVNTLVSLNSQIKWETNPKPVIESVLLLSMGVNNDRTI